MILTEVRNIEFIEFIESVTKEAGFEFIILSVARQADCKRYFPELDKFWKSIDEVTNDKIFYLHFIENDTDFIENRRRKKEESKVYLGGGEFVQSKDLSFSQKFDLYEILKPNSRDNERRRIVSLMRQAKLNIDSMNINEIENGANELLSYFKKKESDIPFLYIGHLNDKNEKYFIKFDYLYNNKESFIYDFLQKLKIKIEEHDCLAKKIQQLENKLLENNKIVKNYEHKIVWFNYLIKKIPTDFNKIATLINNSKLVFNTEQLYYLNSLYERKKYEKIYRLQKLFQHDYLEGEHINSIIGRYAGMELSDIENFVELESKRLSNELSEIKETLQFDTLISTLEKEIKTKKDELSNIYNSFFNSFNQNNNNSHSISTKEKSEKQSVKLRTSQESNKAITEYYNPSPSKMIYVEGKTDKKILEKAIKLFSNKLDGIVIKDCGGDDLVRKEISKFAYDTNKNKGKALAIFDYDKAGSDAHTALTKNNSDFEKELKKGTVKSLLLGKDKKPPHILSFYQKGIFDKGSYGNGICLESFFSFQFWEIAKEKGYLNEIYSLSNIIKNPYNQLPKDFILEKGVSEENLIYIFYEFDKLKKDSFANYICSLEGEDMEKAFEHFKDVINQIENFF